VRFSDVLRTLFRAVLRFAVAIVVFVIIVAAFIVGWRLSADVHTPDEPAKSDATAAATQSAVEYTCSMHPKVRLQDPDAKCPICFMDLIPVTQDQQDSDASRMTMTHAARQLADIQTASVDRFFPTRTVRLFGRLDYDETRIANISAYFPGRIERMFVDYTGVPVQRSDHLVEVYSPELIAAQEELRQAAASVRDVPGGSEAVRRSSEATLRAARRKLRLLGLTDQQIERIETAEEPMDTLTIYSPIAGVVIEKKAVEGAYVETGEPIYTVADLSHLWLRLQAYESQLPWLRYGQDVEFSVDSMPGEVFHGRVAFIDPTVDPVTRTVHVRINVENTQRQLKPGMFARAKVRTRIAGYGLVITDELAGKWICPMHPEAISDGPDDCDLCGMPHVPIEQLGYTVTETDIDAPPLVIPASAALITGTRAVVYVEVPDTDRPTYEGREVVLGPAAGDYYIVKKGLREGERVVVNGAFKIDSAMEIAAKPSMMSPPEQHAKTAEPDARLEVPQTFIYALKPVYAAYFDAQQALADDDLDAFIVAANDLNTAVGLVETAGVVGEPLGRWRRLSRQLATDETAMTQLDSLESARTAFQQWSDVVIQLEQRFGHYGASTHYVVHCPMAFDNEGADWLSRRDEVLNPYFGGSILRCGSVNDEFPPRDAASDEVKP